MALVLNDAQQALMIQRLITGALFWLAVAVSYCAVLSILLRRVRRSYALLAWAAVSLGLTCYVVVRSGNLSWFPGGPIVFAVGALVLVAVPFASSTLVISRWTKQEPRPGLISLIGMGFLGHLGGLAVAAVVLSIPDIYRLLKT